MAVAATIVIVGAAAGIWVMLNDKGPVADNGPVAADPGRPEEGDSHFVGEGAYEGLEIHPTGVSR